VNSALKINSVSQIIVETVFAAQRANAVLTVLTVVITAEKMSSAALILSVIQHHLDVDMKIKKVQKPVPGAVDVTVTEYVQMLKHASNQEIHLALMTRIHVHLQK